MGIFLLEKLECPLQGQIQPLHNLRVIGYTQPASAPKQICSGAHTPSFFSYNDRIIYNWCFTAREVFSWNESIFPLKSWFQRCFAGSSGFHFSSSETYEALKEIHKEHGRSVDLFPAPSEAITTDSPCMHCDFAEKHLCVGVDAVLFALFSCSTETRVLHSVCLLSNNAKCTTKNLLNFFQCKTDGGECRVGGGVQSARNKKSIFHLAENFRRYAFCLLAHRSRGQLFKHPSWASVSSREPSRARDEF